MEESKERNGGTELIDEMLLTNILILLEFGMNRFFSKSSLAESMREVI